jgi:hypothetical protein
MAEEIKYTIELYWKKDGDVYKTKTSSTKIFYNEWTTSHTNYSSYKNNEYHSIDGEHSMYVLSFAGDYIHEEFHKDGKLHNLNGHSQYYFEKDYDNDHFEKTCYYIEGVDVDPTQYKQKVEEYKNTKKQEMKNALLQNTNICQDVCGLISEYVI